MAKERSGGRQQNQLFPLSSKVASDTRGAIRYMYRERYDQLQGHLRIVTPLISYSVAHEGKLDTEYDSLPTGALSTWYTVGLTVTFDSLAFQFKSLRSQGPKVLHQDIQSYRPIRNHLIPEDWFLLPPEEVEVLSDRLRKLLIGTDDQLYQLTEAMREFYINKDGEPSPKIDMAYLSGIADVYIPLHYAYDRERLMRDSN